MNKQLLMDFIEELPVSDRQPSKALRPVSIKKVSDKTLSYSGRHRGQWFKPDFNFAEVHIARKTDGYLFKAVQKKTNRVMVASYEIVGVNPEPRNYVVRRLGEMAWASQTPHDQLVEQTFTQLFSISNCVWVKKRSNELSSGAIRSHFNRAVDPVAAYFVVDFDTLEIKSKRNGEVQKWRQIDPVTGATKEFPSSDVIHFRTNQDPGYNVGFPELQPALDDFALLRRIEENVEDLIEANLFPMFHYKVGSDSLPEAWGPDGRKETDVVKDTIEYMPAGGIYVSDHRHSITAIGSEGRALRIDSYLTHFKNRALAAAGTSALDMGESDGANRSTASTLSKGMLLDIEAMTKVFKRYYDFFVINEILLEGGYDIMDPANKVEIKFGVIDKEERRADENQQIQFFTNNVRTIDEVRKSIGDVPWVDEMDERTFYELYKKPLEMLRAGLLIPEESNAVPEGSGSEKPGPTPSRSSGATQNTVMPANQHGARASAKTTRDVTLTDDSDNEVVIEVSTEATDAQVEAWKASVYDRWNELKDYNVNFNTVIYNMLPQLENK